MKKLAATRDRARSQRTRTRQLRLQGRDRVLLEKLLSPRGQQSMLRALNDPQAVAAIQWRLSRAAKRHTLAGYRHNARRMRAALGL